MQATTTHPSPCSFKDKISLSALDMDVEKLFNVPIISCKPIMVYGVTYLKEKTSNRLFSSLGNYIGEYNPSNNSIAFFNTIASKASPLVNNEKEEDNTETTDDEDEFVVVLEKINVGNVTYLKEKTSSSLFTIEGEYMGEYNSNTKSVCLLDFWAKELNTPILHMTQEEVEAKYSTANKSHHDTSTEEVTEAEETHDIPMEEVEKMEEVEEANEKEANKEEAENCNKDEDEQEENEEAQTEEVTKEATLVTSASPSSPMSYYGEVKCLPNGQMCIHGKGVIQQNNSPNDYFNVFYDGEFYNGIREGQGIEYHLTGQIKYKGSFVNNCFHGIGTLYDERGNIMYQGMFEHGNFNGYGKWFRAGVLQFEGFFVENKLHGVGKQYSATKKVELSGTFQHGRLISGTWYCPNGNVKYEGEFNNAKFHGQGSLYFNNGKARYHGQFEKGKYHGEGTLMNHFGKLEYIGKFKDGKMHGFGTLFSQNKAIFRGRFVGGRRVASTNQL